MDKVTTLQQWADETGRPLADIEAMVAEAEALGEPFDRCDPDARREHGWTAEMDEEFERFMQRAKARAAGGVA